jgi:hypothetical protein
LLGKLAREADGAGDGIGDAFASNEAEVERVQGFDQAGPEVWVAGDAAVEHHRHRGRPRAEALNESPCMIDQ